MQHQRKHSWSTAGLETLCAQKGGLQLAVAGFDSLEEDVRQSVSPKTEKFDIENIRVFAHTIGVILQVERVDL